MGRIKLSKVFLNDENPRILDDQKAGELWQSLVNFPEMLEIRPIVIDEKNLVLMVST